MTRHRFALMWGVSLLLVIVGLGAMAQPVRTAEALTNCSVSATDADLDGEEFALVGLINDYRAANGRGVTNDVMPICARAGS